MDFTIRLDHIGIATLNLKETTNLYKLFFGLITYSEEFNPDQLVSETLLEIPNSSSKIQIIEPTHTDSAIAKFIFKKGPGLQQLAFEVSDMNSFNRHIQSLGVDMLYSTARVGSNNSYINFIHPKHTGGVLIEILCYQAS